MVISVLVIHSLPQLLIAAVATVFITNVCNPSIEVFGHSEKVVSIENSSSVKNAIADHLLKSIVVAEFSHRCEKLTK